MERPAGRQAATEARKAQIATATITVLARRGYAATTFEAICEQAGLSSKRLISYHFASKDELFAAVVRQVVQDAAAFMRPALDAADGARAQLEAFIRANIAFIAANPDHVRAVQQLAHHGTPVGQDESEAAVDRLAELLAGGQRTGSFRPFEPRLMAATVRSAIDGAAGRLAEGMDARLCADELAETFDRATRA
ncbi:TetR/AcrR family transcriptional regulator [Nonomuraea sp. 3-1Str]|uniref:TetR/AcrR family transcriptional regulator n=1 Tax=unclassified Nonomuraea TaxID=2593643 RepID=UPI0028632B57|nr:TetR/AcrR family transcriptional regulator [Nonomuraea sp. 3-1Str]MDR8414838.1 TetR family transcriptional regulator [Nonomuraea sp. 3-1Str]